MVGDEPGDSLPMMHSRLLMLFLTVAEHRNITAAARALNITQPALTRSIKQLEAIIGVPLFERLPTGVVLTREGEILARRVKLMDLEYRHALAEISAFEQGLAGELRIGAGPVWITTILPKVVTTFHGAYPKIKVRLTSGVINTLVPALMDGEIDLICSTLDFPSQPEIVKEPLIKIRHAVVARESHPLFGRGPASAEDLSGYPWLVLANDEVGTSRVGSYFVANGLEPPVIAVETTASGMLKILREGDFLAHFPDQMLEDVEKFGLCRIAHEGTFWESEAGITFRRTNRPVRAVESFKTILRSSLAEQAGAIT
jgi:DNA-binding transcriptional LysR family regulator